MTENRRATYQRIARRETHSPRSVLAIAVSVVVIVVCAWLIVELVLAMIGAPALLVAPADGIEALVDVPSYPVALVVAAGAVAVVIGLAVLVAALAAGRRARHVMDSERAVTVADNEVIASALARHAARSAGIDPDNTSVSVSHRRATVTLTPSSGTRVDREAVSEAVAAQLESYGLRPPVRSRVVVTENGRVGS